MALVKPKASARKRAARKAAKPKEKPARVVEVALPSQGL